jgi:3-oxoacyl-[acyl-carrier protein] reductase
MTSPDRFIVTGSASGIGLRVTQLLAALGHRVLATDIHLEALEAAAERDGWSRDRIRLESLDVTDPTEWERVLAAAVDGWGGVDVVYNVAGYLAPAWVHEIALADVDRHFDINVKGVVYGTRAASQQMVRQGEGHIVNIASMAAHAPVPGLSLYSASKYAVRCFSLAAAVELQPRGVAVTVVCPDAVATPMLDKQRDYEEAALTFTAPRILTVDEVAEHLVGPVLRKRPLETALPRRRKWLAKMVDLAPGLAQVVRPLFMKQGKAAQARARAKDSAR